MEEERVYILKCNECGAESNDVRQDLHAFDGWAGNGTERRCPECVQKRLDQTDKTHFETTRLNMRTVLFPRL